MFANKAFLSIQSIPQNRFGFTPTRRNPSRISTSCSTSTVEAVTKKRPAANLYDVLDLNRSASPSQIKAAYRSLVKQFHPDTNKAGSDGGYFIEIHDAYETLSDPMAKARYDLSLSLSLSICGADRISGYPDFVGRTTSRWETDQCW